MPTLNNKQVDTVKHDGKIFVLECMCGKKDGYFTSRLEEFGSFGMIAGRELFGKRISCDKCEYFPWIILPKKEK